MAENKNFKDVNNNVEMEIGTEATSAKFKNFVSYKVYSQVNEVAKKHGGSYSKDAKQFLFETAKGRDDFIDEVAKLKVQSFEKVQPENKWTAKKSYAEKRVADLTKSVNEILPKKLVEVFKCIVRTVKLNRFLMTKAML